MLAIATPEQPQDEVAANPSAWIPWNYQAALTPQNPSPEPPD